MDRAAEIGRSDSGSLSGLVLVLHFGIGPHLGQSGKSLAFTDILVVFECELGYSQPVFGLRC